MRALHPLFATLLPCFAGDTSPLHIPHYSLLLSAGMAAANNRGEKRHASGGEFSHSVPSLSSISICSFCSSLPAFQPCVMTTFFPYFLLSWVLLFFFAYHHGMRHSCFLHFLACSEKAAPTLPVPYTTAATLPQHRRHLFSHISLSLPHYLPTPSPFDIWQDIKHFTGTCSLDRRGHVAACFVLAWPLLAWDCFLDSVGQDRPTHRAFWDRTGGQAGGGRHGEVAGNTFCLHGVGR